MNRRGRRARRGATIVEMAIIAPLAFLLIIGLIVTALGVFRLHQVGRLAHEGARWASVHGSEWETQTRHSPITPLEVYREALLPNAQGLKAERLEYVVEWDEDRSVVHVTVKYRWLPEAFLSISTLTGTSVRPISY